MAYPGFIHASVISEALAYPVVLLCLCFAGRCREILCHTAAILLLSLRGGGLDGIVSKMSVLTIRLKSLGVIYNATMK